MPILCVVALLAGSYPHGAVRAEGGSCTPLETELLATEIAVVSEGDGSFYSYDSSVSQVGDSVVVSVSGEYYHEGAAATSFTLGNHQLFDVTSEEASVFVHARSLTIDITESAYLASGSTLIEWDCSSDACADFAPDSRSAEVTNDGTISYYQMVVSVGAGVGLVEFDLSWEFYVVEGSGCTYPGDVEPTPEPTAGPTAEMGAGTRRLLAVPDGCDGIEVLPTQWGLIPVDGSWSQNVSHGYTSGYRVRWTFRAEAGRSHKANVNVNGFLLGLAWSGPSAGEDLYYEVTWPATFTENPAVLLAQNTGVETIMIASICLQPVRTIGQCSNADPEFDSPIDWEIGYPAYINNGALNLRPGGWAQQQTYLTAGTYRIQLQAQSSTNQSFELYVGSNLYKQVNVPAGDVPTHFWYDFSVSDNPILTMLMPTSAPADANVRIHYVCISLIAAATPTPTPPPTPTPMPPPQSCDNAGYDFSMPELWTLDGAMILPEQGTGKNILLLYYDSAAWQTIRIPQGQYVLTVRAARGISGNEPAGFEVIFGWTVMGQWVINPIADPNEIVEFMSVEYLEGGEHLLLIRPLAGYFGGRIYSVCLSYVGNPNPHPTSTPGATPTPQTTPWPDPSNCVNPDSGIDGGGDIWVILGVGGSIQDSEATLKPGNQLASDITPDPLIDYDVLIAGYCTSPSTVNVYWRGQMHTLLCVGGSPPLPFKYKFYFPADSPSFVSSPLVELLRPELSRGSIPQDLPPGLVPQLMYSPLNVPQYALSPLGTPDFPEADAVDPLMMVMSSIMQIQASTANTGDVVITSVCVQDREWVPPADPPQISLFHPVCERDYAIQASHSAISPIMLIGLGAQSGMPVHAMYGGAVTAAGPEQSYTFGGVRYEGCVTIDHTAALGVGLQSVYCNLDTFAVSGGGGDVARGQFLGHTGDRSSYGILQPSGVGLVMVGVFYDDEWVNPVSFFSGFVDCHPYRVIIEPMDRCDADDGSGLIPPRYNMPAPSLWEPAQWVPWLSRRLYDTLGYPILCALIPAINAIMAVIQDITNAIITVLTSPLLFLYRIGRIFEYMLSVFGRVLTAILALFDDAAQLAVCFRSIIVYFISAMTAARNAERPTLELTPGPLLYSINLALLLISSTVANAILVPAVGLLIAYASWQLIPWGIHNIRSAIGAGE